MKIAYFSLTGQTRRFVDKLNMESIEVSAKDYSHKVNEEFILLVPTYDDDVTEFIKKFINYEDNFFYLKGIVASGNRNFAKDFAFTGKNLAKEYRVPLLMEFEFSGTNEDVIKLKSEVEKIENNTNS